MHAKINRQMKQAQILHFIDYPQQKSNEKNLIHDSNST